MEKSRTTKTEASEPLTTPSRKTNTPDKPASDERVVQAAPHGRSDQPSENSHAEIANGDLHREGGENDVHHREAGETANQEHRWKRDREHGEDR